MNFNLAKLFYLPFLLSLLIPSAHADIGFEFETGLISPIREKSCPGAQCHKKDLQRKDKVFSHEDFSIETDDTQKASILAKLMERPTDYRYLIKNMTESNLSSVEFVTPPSSGFKLTDSGREKFLSVLENMNKILQYIIANQHLPILPAKNLESIVDNGKSHKDTGLSVRPWMQVMDDGPPFTMQATLGISLRCLPKFIRNLTDICSEKRKVTKFLENAEKAVHSLEDDSRLSREENKLWKEQLSGFTALVASFLDGARIVGKAQANGGAWEMKSSLSVFPRNDLSELFKLISQPISEETLLKLVAQTFYDNDSDIKKLDEEMFGINFAKELQNNGYHPKFSQREWISEIYRGKNSVAEGEFILWVPNTYDKNEHLRNYEGLEPAEIAQLLGEHFDKEKKEYIDPFQSIGTLKTMDNANGETQPIFEIRCLGRYENRTQLKERALEIFDYARQFETNCGSIR